ncbi:GNAT family acetyltransferase [Pedobacter sp. PACM 27299]|uniref:GNAT family N-acetyltransferase n=1 Tax=Pedobacter sp. PACM 27299 TaxID=1727164 RepID=UPI000706286A|nr:GNAT family N-acetyltransferase [Pedobacter sp. PACM 27299]ALL04820.1 GNAT family acetyltransferase [Pedobacter sp. PACM 27299]
MNTNIHLSRTNPDHLDFRKLIALLDENLSENNGEAQSFFDQFNKTDQIKHVVIAYMEGVAIGCGSIKAYDSGTMEVKRMFVHPEFRNTGIATKILSHLEQWAKEMGYERCILETGEKQKEAVILYQKRGYQQISNYGQYEHVADSICMEKKLKDLSTAV